MNTKRNVLFLCSHNSARSQMAEAFLRKYGIDRFEAFSAGLEAKELNPYTVKVMNEIGIDMSGHYSKTLESFLDKEFSHLITVCSAADAGCPFFPGAGERLHWPFDDPSAAQGTESEIIAKFREVRDQIEKKIQSWLSEQSTAV